MGRIPGKKVIVMVIHPAIDTMVDRAGYLGVFLRSVLIGLFWFSLGVSLVFFLPVLFLLLIFACLGSGVVGGILYLRGYFDPEFRKHYLIMDVSDSFDEDLYATCNKEHE